MIYARSRNTATVHRIESDPLTPTMPAACGYRPRYHSWFGQDTWQFYQSEPTPEGVWATAGREELRCKRCFRPTKKAK